MEVNLKKIAVYKAIAVCGLIAVAYPMLFWWLNSNYSTWNVIQLLQWEIVITSLSAIFVFGGLLFRHRCPMCKKWWCYRPVVTMPISEVVQTKALRLGRKVLSLQRVAVEWACSQCNHRKLLPKNKIIQEEIRDE